jgi:hypothetical protein
MNFEFGMSSIFFTQTLSSQLTLAAASQGFLRISISFPASDVFVTMTQLSQFEKFAHMV